MNASIKLIWHKIIDPTAFSGDTLYHKIKICWVILEMKHQDRHTHNLLIINMPCTLYKLGNVCTVSQLWLVIFSRFSTHKHLLICSISSYVRPFCQDMTSDLCEWHQWHQSCLKSVTFAWVVYMAPVGLGDDVITGHSLM